MVWLAAFTFTALPVARGQVRQGSFTPVVESLDRGYSSISYWTYRDDGVEIGGGRISVEHGKPSWPAALDSPESFDRATIGRLWRLGNNKWSTLDTNLRLHFGDVVVEPGIYYVAVERPSANGWGLVFISPEAVSGQLIDAWASQARPAEVPRLFTVALRHASGDKASELDMSLSLSSGAMSEGSLVIRWGIHELDTAFSIEMVSPTFYRSGSSGK